MSFNKKNTGDYTSLGSSKKKGGSERADQSSLSRKKNKKGKTNGNTESDNNGLINFSKEQEKKLAPHVSNGLDEDLENAGVFSLKSKKPKDEFKEVLGDDTETVSDENSLNPAISNQPQELEYAQELKKNKRRKRAEKDFNILKNENWVVRNGHNLTYIGLFCFTVLVFFRPYELVPGLGFLSATAFYFAIGTLFVYLPTQLATEGNLTHFSTEVKCIVLITLLALVTMPIAKSPSIAWEEFNGSFSKAVIMFIVMVNVIRTRERLMGIMWISLSVAFVLSYMALTMFLRGEITVEGYRVGVEIGGMFGNPNDLAMHLVMMVPLAICLGIAAKSFLLRNLYFIAAGLFVAGTVVTYSRGGFLGLVAMGIVLVWKLGKKQKVKIFFLSSVLISVFLVLAPGEYSNRIFSIFDSGLDAVGSSNQRTELLKRSIIVSVRNPWGIGIGNFPIVGQRNLGTHNFYTQLSSELGLLALGAMFVFLISPFRKLAAIERRLLAKDETKWFYYLAVGLQASIVAFMVSSFFNHVAYNWYVYYLIAYAVAFRRVYINEKGLDESEITPPPVADNILDWRKQTA